MSACVWCGDTVEVGDVTRLCIICSLARAPDVALATALDAGRLEAELVALKAAHRMCKYDYMGACVDMKEAEKERDRLRAANAKAREVLDALKAKLAYADGATNLMSWLTGARVDVREALAALDPEPAKCSHGWQLAASCDQCNPYKPEAKPQAPACKHEWELPRYGWQRRYCLYCEAPEPADPEAPAKDEPELEGKPLHQVYVAGYQDGMLKNRDAIARAVAQTWEQAAQVAEAYDPPDEDCSIQDGIAAALRARGQS